MKNKKSENQDLESLLRKGLGNVHEAPDANTWEQLATRQRPQNTWLKFRHYGLYSLPLLVLLLAGIAWWQFATPQAPEQAKVPQNPQTEQQAKPDVPVAALENSAAENQLEIPEPETSARNDRAQQLNSVPASVVRFNANAGVDYQSPSTGTRVRIPAGALIDKNGTPVQGSVDLVFREYRDISEFLASGIPMHYADERGSFFFNSGGMFEVRVNQKGEQLAIAPGQSFEVEFSPTAELESASLYYLDDATGAWAYQPNAEFDKLSQHQKLQAGNNPSNLPPVVAEAVAVRNNRAGLQVECLPTLPELPLNANTAEWVCTGVQTGYELATGALKMPGWFLKYPELTHEQLSNSLERGLIRIVRNRDLGELFFPEDLNDVFTELKAFKDCYFMRSADSILALKKIPDDVYWDRVSVKQDIGNSCIVSFYSEKEGLLQFYATLSSSIGNKDFDADRVFAEYNKLRTERQENREALVNKLHRFFRTANMFMPEKEWCMTPLEWLQYFEKQHPMMTKRYADKMGVCSDEQAALDAWASWRDRALYYYSNATDQTRIAGINFRNSHTLLRLTLRLNNFGTYNCDQIFRLGTRDPVYADAIYQTNDGNRIVASTVSVMERSTRLFFTMPNASKLIQTPNRSLDVVIMDGNGRRFHLPANDYSRATKEQNAVNTYTVTDITDKTHTPRDWATYLGI